MCQFLGVLCVGLEQVCHFKHQVQGTAIADPHLLVRPQPVKHRQAGSEVGADLELGCCLPAVGVGHQQVGTDGSGFKILKVTHKDVVTGQAVQPAGAGGCQGSLDLAAHACQKTGHPFQMVGLKGDGNLFVAKLVVAVHQRISQS